MVGKQTLEHDLTAFIIKPFSITGAWIGLCEMPDYKAIEVYRIVVRQERAVFSFFSFRPDSTPVERFVGSGIFRGKFFSAFYYSPKADNQESGVISLQVGTKGNRLQGTFTQYTEDDSLLGDHKMPDRRKVELTRIRVSLLQWLRMIFWRQPFETYTQVLQEFEKATKLYQRPAAGDVARLDDGAINGQTEKSARADRKN